VSKFTDRMERRTNRRETVPTRQLTPKLPTCWRCSMPGASRCEFPGCGRPLCRKHCIRKGGGHLCSEHEGAKLVQDDSVPSTRFKDAGEAVHHDELILKGVKHG
jgi:hypothetical protein